MVDTVWYIRIIASLGMLICGFGWMYLYITKRNKMSFIGLGIFFILAGLFNLIYIIGY